MQLMRIGNLNQEKPCVMVNDKIFDLSNEFEDWNHDFFQNDGLNKLKKLLSEKSFEEIAPDQRIGACITRPHKVICIGLNYIDHAKDSGMEVPNATSVKPITNSETPNRFAILIAEFTKKSEPLRSKTNPIKNNSASVNTIKTLSSFFESLG